MEIVNLDIDAITPYVRNAKKHPEWQIEQIMASIDLYGDNDPIAVWGPTNLIVEGHGRYEALKRLGHTSVPCIRLDHLTDKERREYTILHNKLNMDTGFDLGVLGEELEDLDLGGFDLDLEEKHQQEKETTQFRKSDILNLEMRQFPGVGPYDIPPIAPVHADEIGEIREWIGFNYVMSDKDPTGKGVHFFVDDYQFERVFSQPDKYVEKLRQYAAVLSPDFSPFGDMPMATQIFNHYRKHWCAAYWQENGVTVIPTIRASTDPRSLEWYLDGEPEGGVVCISSMYTRDKESKDYYLREHNTMVERLAPEKVLVYGKLIDGALGALERIATFTEGRWSR